MTPDAATVTISVARQGGTPGWARLRDNAVLTAILADLRAAGLPATDVQTSYISLANDGSAPSPGPLLRRRRHPPRWVASATLTIDTTHVDLVSRIFAIASSDGGDNVDGPNYRVADPAAGRLAAEAAAVRDARRRADSASAAAGMRVIGTQSIDLDPGSGNAFGQATQQAVNSAPTHGSGSAVRAPIPTPTAAGKEQVNATVDVVFLLGPG